MEQEGQQKMPSLAKGCPCTHKWSIRTLSHFLTAPLIFSPPRTIIQIRKIRASSNHETRQVEGGDGTLVRVTLSSLKSTCGCWRNVVRSSTFPIICSTLFTSSSLTCKSHIHFIAKHALRKLGLYEFICTVYEWICVQHVCIPFPAQNQNLSSFNPKSMNLILFPSPLSFLILLLLKLCHRPPRP